MRTHERLAMNPQDDVICKVLFKALKPYEFNIAAMESEAKKLEGELGKLKDQIKEAKSELAHIEAFRQKHLDAIRQKE